MSVCQGDVEVDSQRADESQKPRGKEAHFRMDTADEVGCRDGAEGGGRGGGRERWLWVSPPTLM